MRRTRAAALVRQPEEPEDQSFAVRPPRQRLSTGMAKAPPLRRTGTGRRLSTQTAEERPLQQKLIDRVVKAAVAGNLADFDLYYDVLGDHLESWYPERNNPARLQAWIALALAVARAQPPFDIRLRLFQRLTQDKQGGALYYLEHLSD